MLKKVDKEENSEEELFRGPACDGRGGRHVGVDGI